MTYVKGVHGQDLTPNLSIVVWLDAATPVRWDPLATVEDILSVGSLVGGEERHHSHFVGSASSSREQLVEERSCSIQEQRSWSKEKVAVVTAGLHVSLLTVLCKCLQIAVAVAVRHHLGEELVEGSAIDR